MGDRANVFVKFGDGGVYLYTQDGGAGLPHRVQKALARKQRWTHPSYLARIIFDAMVDKKEHGEELGFGISNAAEDGRDRVLEIDCRLQTVTARGGMTWSFVDFLKLERGCRVWPSNYNPD